MFKYLKYIKKTWFGLYFLPIVYFSETLKHPLAAPCRFQTSVKKKNQINYWCYLQKFMSYSPNLMSFIFSIR